MGRYQVLAHLWKRQHLEYYLFCLDLRKEGWTIGFELQADGRSESFSEHYDFHFHAVTNILQQFMWEDPARALKYIQECIKA